mmetsp:Transcript_12531/g.48861  ORF Transcript_12531/g.48861 Transcript_12531/m.48861 type:complete len:237 (+) Transcript_12531:216-926(+)
MARKASSSSRDHASVSPSGSAADSSTSARSSRRGDESVTARCASLRAVGGGTCATTLVPSAQYVSLSTTPALRTSPMTPPLSYGTSISTRTSATRTSVSCSACTRESMPNPVSADVATAPAALASSANAFGSTPAAIDASDLFHTVTRGMSLAPNSARTASTAATCAPLRGEDTSTTCTSIVESTISSKVALKAATSSVGKFWMKPTVSVTRTSFPLGSGNLRVVGSRVAKSWSSA